VDESKIEKKVERNVVLCIIGTIFYLFLRGRVYVL